MLKKCTAIVLRTIKYNDRTDIADVYTNIGRLSFAINRTSARGRIPMRILFKPFAILEIVGDINPKSNIHKIKEVQNAMILNSIQFNPAKQSMAFFLAEFLAHTLQNDNEDKLMFSYITNSIEWLDKCEKGYANFHLVFLIRIAGLLGLKPDTSTFSKGTVFDLENAIFTNTLPQNGHYLSPQETESLYQLMRMRYSTMHLFKMNRDERNRCLDIIMKYYSLHIADLSSMKSWSVLRELFA